MIDILIIIHKKAQEFIIPEPIKDLLSGKCYEGIFEDLKKEGII